MTAKGRTESFGRTVPTDYLSLMQAPSDPRGSCIRPLVV
jgi:hypothetical protein